MGTPDWPQRYQQGRPPQHGQPYGPSQPYGRPPAPQYGPPPARPQYGPPQYGPYGASYPGQAAEGIAVTTRVFPLFFTLLLFKPRISVDGHQLPHAVWGRNVIPAPPGRHHVHTHVPYFLPPRLGPADAPVDVYPGRIAELEYRAPAFFLSPGSLGQGPQKYNGIGLLVAFALVPAVFVILMIIFTAVAAKP